MVRKLEGVLYLLKAFWHNIQSYMRNINKYIQKLAPTYCEFTGTLQSHYIYTFTDTAIIHTLSFNHIFTHSKLHLFIQNCIYPHIHALKTTFILHVLRLLQSS